MKIAIVTSRPVPRDAVSNFIMDSAAALKERGDVTIFTFGFDREPVQGLRIRYMGGENSHSIKSNLLALAHTRALARELAEYDVIVQNNPDMGSLLACHQAKKLNPQLRLLWSFAGITPNEHMAQRKDRVLNSIRRPLYVASMRASDGVHVFSPFIQRELSSSNVPGTKVAVIPFGIDTRRFAGGDGDKVRKKHGLTGFVVLYVGRLVLHKHVDEIIRAVNLCPDVTLLVVGTGPERDSLDHLSTRVVFAGAVPDEELPDYYAVADVLALASRHEGFCVPIAEAMAAGKPCIVPMAGAMPETAGDIANAYPSGSVICLAERIEKMRQDIVRRARMGESARELSALYDRDTTMKRFADFVEGI